MILLENQSVVRQTIYTFVRVVQLHPKVIYCLFIALKVETHETNDIASQTICPEIDNLSLDKQSVLRQTVCQCSTASSHGPCMVCL